MPRIEDLTCIGKQTGLTIADTALGLTIPSGIKPRAASVQIFTQPVRYWANGSTPTSSAGLKANDQDIIELYNNEVYNFLVIREGGSSASAEILFYG